MKQAYALIDHSEMLKNQQFELEKMETVPSNKTFTTVIDQLSAISSAIKLTSNGDVFLDQTSSKMNEIKTDTQKIFNTTIEDLTLKLQTSQQKLKDQISKNLDDSNQHQVEK